ncbi:E3 ubiquitin-protein ligase MARCH8-like, partial [Phalaenopsis equestris]
MAWLEERHPQFENFVGIYLTDADERHCKSANEQNLSYENCQLPKSSNVEQAGVDMDLECGSMDFKAIVDKSEKDCRICFISLKDFSQELGVPIMLGCSCNGDLAFAHQKCAEKWFELKGN